MNSDDYEFYSVMKKGTPLIFNETTVVEFQNMIEDSVLVKMEDGKMSVIPFPDLQIPNGIKQALLYSVKNNLVTKLRNNKIAQSISGIGYRVEANRLAREKYSKE